MVSVKEISAMAKAVTQRCVARTRVRRMKDADKAVVISVAGSRELAGAALTLQKNGLVDDTLAMAPELGDQEAKTQTNSDTLPGVVVMSTAAPGGGEHNGYNGAQHNGQNAGYANGHRPLLSLSKKSQALAPAATDANTRTEHAKASEPQRVGTEHHTDMGWFTALQEENLALKKALNLARRQIVSDSKSLALLKHQSKYDGLTNTPNRLLLQDRFLQALRQAKRSGQLLGLLFIDLDHFKTINDHFGHSTGDAVLQAVSQRLQQSIRNSDTLCRYGGDEFVLLLPVLLRLSDARAIAAKIISAIAAPLELNGQMFELSGSLGIALYPSDGDSISSLTSAADQAMYQAKAKGGGCFVFNGATATSTAAAPHLRAVKLLRGSAGGLVLQRQRLY